MLSIARGDAMTGTMQVDEFLGLDDAGKLERIKTPLGGGGLFGKIARGRMIPGLVARLAAKVARGRKPLRLGKTVIAIRHDHVCEAFDRDLDFLIGPVNKQKIEEVSGPFVLGMDRSPAHGAQRMMLYTALRDTSLEPIIEASTEYAEKLLEDSGGTIDAVDDYARKVAARTASALFGISGPDDQLFLEATRSIFGHTFLNLGNDETIRQRAVLAGALIRQLFEVEIANRAEPYGNPDLMDALLRAGASEDDTRLILAGMLVGAIDTTTSSVARILCVLDRDDDIRAKFEGATTREDQWGLCLEALRRWPHNPIVLRQAADDTTLGGATIGKASRVVLFTHAAMLDKSTFPDHQLAVADRNRRAYFHFGGGLHPCSGIPINALQIPMLVSLLVERQYRTRGAINWAGPFPHNLNIDHSGTTS